MGRGASSGPSRRSRNAASSWPSATSRSRTSRRRPPRSGRRGGPAAIWATTRSAACGGEAQQRDLVGVLDHPQRRAGPSMASDELGVRAARRWSRSRWSAQQRVRRRPTRTAASARSRRRPPATSAYGSSVSSQVTISIGVAAAGSRPRRASRRGTTRTGAPAPARTSIVSRSSGMRVVAGQVAQVGTDPDAAARRARPRRRRARRPSSRAAKRSAGMVGSRRERSRPRSPPVPAVASHARDRRRAVLEQLPVGEHPVGAGGRGRACAAPRRRAGRPRGRGAPASAAASNGGDAVVGAGGQVDDRGVGAGERLVRARRASATRCAVGAGGLDAARARRVDQMRSSARTTTRVIATRSALSRALARGGGRRPRGDDSGRAAVLDDRDVAEAADGHLVDRDGDVSSWRRTTGSRVMKSATCERIEALAGDLQDRVAVGEDADEAAVVDDQHAVEPCRVHPLDGLVDGAPRLEHVRGGGAPELVEVLAEEPAAEVEAAACGASRPARSAPQLSQVSSPMRFSKPQDGQRIAWSVSATGPWSGDRPGLAACERLGRSPSPWRRRPPRSGRRQLVVRRPGDGPEDADRDREVRPEHPRQHEARYGSSACSSWTSRSASVTPFSPIVTTSGCRPRRRMPLSRSLPKIIGLPCSSTSIRSSRTSRSVKSRHAPSLKMLQFWRTSTNVEPWWRPARSSVFWRCSVWVSTAAGDERRLGREGDRERLDRRVDGARRRRLRLLAELRRRARLALREAVDAVVEHHHLDVDVAPHRVDHVVAADREGVAVAGDDPDHEVRAGGLEAGGEGRRAAVDRVEAVGVHVVRQPAGAADAGDEDDVLLRHAEVGHHPSGSGRGSSSRRSPGTSGLPGRTRSPSGSAR